MLALQPFAATREFSSWALPPMHLPRWMNRISYGWSLMRVLRLAFGKKVEELRGNILGSSSVPTDPSRFLTLYGISRHLIKPPEDWPSSHRICGQWSLEPSHYRPSLGLERFLAAGEAPLYVGMGTASSFLGHKLLTTIVSAVAGRRALFFPGWSRGSRALTQLIQPPRG